MNPEKQEESKEDRRKDCVSPPRGRSPQRGILSESLHPSSSSAATTAGESRRFKSPTSPTQERLKVSSTFKSKKPISFVASGSTALKKNLGLESLAPDADEKARETAVLLRGAEPKVQVPFNPIPGQAPRRVQVERLKNEFAQMSLSELLQANGIDEFESQPTKPKSNNDINDAELSGDSTTQGDLESELETEELLMMLPLYPFDDMEFESRDRKEWIQLGTDPNTGKFVGLPAKGKRGKEWVDCIVRRWEIAEDQDKLTVEFRDSHESRVLTRLEVMLVAECPINFVQRLKFAYRKRFEAGLFLDYNLSIDSMPVNDTTSLDPEQISRIVNRSSGPTKLQQVPKTSVSELIEQVKFSYARAMNKVILDKMLADPNTAKDPLAGHVLADLLENKDLLLQGFEGSSGINNFRFQAPRTSAVVPTSDVSMHVRQDQFRDTFKDFSFRSLYTQGGVIVALESITQDCVKILKHSLFNTTIAKSVKLDEFQHLQSTAASNTLSFIKGKWTMAIKNHIRSSFKDVGKGWFNLKESSVEVYNFSKLKRFFTLVNCMMQDSMRFMVIQSLQDFANFLHKSADGKVVIHSATEVAMFDNDGTSKKPIPLFALDLVVEENNPSVSSSSSTPAPTAANSKPHPEEGDSQESSNLSADGQADLEQEGKDEEQEERGQAGEEGEDGEDVQPDEANVDPPETTSPERRYVIQYNLDPAVFVTAPVELFFKAITSLDNVPRVEKQVMDKLFWSDEPLIKSVNQHEPWVSSLAQDIKSTMQHATQPLRAYVRQYDQHLDFLNFDIDEFMRQVEVDCRDGTEEEDDDDDDKGEGLRRPVLLDPVKIKALIEKHSAAKLEIEETIPNIINVGAFSISCSNLKKLFEQKHQKIVDNLRNLLYSRTVELGSYLMEQFNGLKREVDKSVENIEELTALQNFMETVPSKVHELERDSKKMFKGIHILESLWIQYKTQDEFDLPWTVYAGPKMVYEALEKAEVRNEKTKLSYADQQQEEQEAFKAVIAQLQQDIDGLGQYTDLERIGVIHKRILDLRARLNQAEEEARKFNSREVLFEMEVTDYDIISQLDKEFELFEMMWCAAHDWLENSKRWLSSKFSELDADEIDREVGNYHRNLIRSVKTFERRGQEDVAKVAELIKTEVDAFKPAVPLVLALRNPGMRERHWKQINTKLGYATKPALDPEDPNFTLERLISEDLGLLKDLSKGDMIVKFGEVAAKEFQIEQALDKMENEWKGVDLDIVPYKETGTFVLRGFDELQALLDEHVTMTQAMMFSAFKGPFEERIEKWNQTLSVVSEVLDEWMAVQRNWLYLQPIFDSPDINKQLPTEGKRFATVDKNWRSTLAAAHEKPLAIRFCANENLLDRWIESNKFLDMVSKGLSDYLETKRGAFSRFYFLSNEELLEILSQTKDPTMVQPHLKKCFEGIKRVHFDENGVITDMFSSEGEQIQLSTAIDPDGRNVEDWMTMLDNTMKQSVKEVLYASMLEYVEIPRTDWIQKVPGQCAINGSQFHWTREIEEALDEKGAEGVAECFDQQVRQINDMVDLVRDPNLKKMARITLSALTVIDVHARDVTEKLKDAQVSDKEAFLWISQMRFYWEDGEALDGDMRVMMVSSRRPYGYEYLGNSFRLVITPLTDKCYLTLMGALQMTLGGAPAGPAGTGKTETTKDLAKALAKQCVVFNCSDGLDYLAMGKFFKGLGSCGAWACFDEFNRIDVEVLSVVAQQIMTLQHAAKAGLDKIEFEGTVIRMNDQFAVYITMNPGYAGRTELPDNLKALFRPVAMMVPDYALIGEIMLYSFGYQKARICAKKMVATFQLCSEQLSSQDHYDYGMRAVKTVIVAAGNLKAAEPEADEEVLLLRALQDVNLPKFLSHDLPLFKGIISDLFPGLSRPHIDYGELLKCLKLTSEKMGLQPVPFFMQKCIQLYETIVVRHGLMLVGPTGGGKSRNVECLDATLCLLKERGIEGFAFENVIRHSLNPKSITMGQLYGEFDPNTHEWQDGILAWLVRECAKSSSPDRKWIVFDGPVDAIWIENMNTVLDDNKKLCLNSGEIIALSPEMTMMFEVEDLQVASPATVSRVGIVYMEPHSLGLEPIQRSWLEKLPLATSTPAFKEKLQTLFDLYVKSVIWFLRRNLREPVPTCDNALNASLLKCLDCYFVQFHVAEGADAPPKSKVNEFFQDLEATFLFCMVWSLCCTVDEPGRQKFDAYVRTLMASHSSAFEFPEEGMIYDYVWGLPVDLPDADSGQQPRKRWVKWMDTIRPFSCDADLSFHETIVPTKDSVCYTYLIDIHMRNNKHLLMTGPTGTGKTVNIATHISTGLPANYIPLPLTFSAQTSANQTQDLIDGKCEKRRKGVYGPPAGKQYIIFIDDLNMPKREEYFAQPPIEIIRQWFTYGGWYDRKTLTFKKLIDITMIAAMGPPGGGRNPVTGRLIRHYTVVNYTVMSDESMMNIYNTILSAFLSGGFEQELRDLGEPIVRSTIDVFQTICKELLPTPAKSHYTYNLRDVGKVFQGLLMVNSKKVSTKEHLIRAWVHESRRVFADRLINDEDRQWFEKQLEHHIEDDLGASLGKLGDLSNLIFCDFVDPSADPVYEEVTDVPGLIPTVEEFLVDYNAESKSPMNLVMFTDAIKHICRIARVLRQPLGNVLLLGVGGSGRQSLTKLATFICDYSLFQVEITKGYGMAEWRDDVKKALMLAGLEDKQVSFLFVDTQIIDEQMLEDINGVLNSGDIPNLYAAEDLESIMTACKIECTKKRIPPTKINIYAQYLIRVKRNIHVCICMSPGTAVFRDRLRMFPSLVNCCAIDWFSEWPEEALRSVGMGIMQEVDLKLGDHLENIVELFKIFHQSVAEASVDYYASLRRYNYVTPTSYLELLNTFKVLLQKKRVQVGGLVSRLQTGLSKLLSTSEMVADLQKELTEMQPTLVKTQAEVEEMIKQIAKDKEGAKETMEMVAVEEAEAEKKAAKTKEIADDAQRDLDEALPALDQAVACLNRLKKSDLDEVKSLKTPPKGVKLTMEAACIMFGVKPTMVNDPDQVGKKVKDYWVAAKGTILQNAGQLLQDLMNFDKDNIAEKTIEQIEPYIEMPEFTPAEIEKASKACTAICMWVRAMFKYHNVAKAVEPKKVLLAEAQAELEVTMASLNDARGRLKAVQDQIQALENEFEKSNAKKLQLEADVEQCAARLERAKKLIGGLGGERDRWTSSIEQLKTDYINLIGDVLISSGCIAYLGPFTSTFRASLTEKWLTDLERLSLPHTAGVDIVKTLGDPVTIRSWNICGLPTDTHSTQNGIIISEARRWPLLIDPQTQANRYIKNLGRDKSFAPNGIEVVKQSDKNYIRALENGVRFGKWVLMENVGQKLDAALEPVLLQQTFRQGSQLMIRLGESTIPYNDNFKFFMTTKLPNPHYPPEVAVKVSLLNFSITPKGLEDQLLGVVMVTELPEKEEKKNALVVNNARMGKELKDLEDLILSMLSNSQGNILDDAQLIETLASSKATSQEINEKVAEAKITERELDEERERYRPVAFRGSLLFFTISELRNIDPMYEYSLQFFVALFKNAILKSEHPEDPEDVLKRIELLNDFFTYSLYQNICRSLFEKDKLLFSFSLVIKVLQGDGKIDDTTWRFLLSAQAPRVRNNSVEMPKGHDWVTTQMWSQLVTMAEGLDAFEDFLEHFVEHLDEWQKYFNTETCYKEKLPGEFDTKLTMLEKMCVLRCLRPDKIIESVQQFVSAHFGQRFIEPPPFDIECSFADSSVITPLIFVLTSGSDPTKDFLQFADAKGKKVSSISLGQGQGPLAESLIEQGASRGSWVLLQNCHLASSWMPKLEQICEDIDPDTVHQDFRLWLTSMPSKTFPVAVLQAGIKMTKEPPKGLRANLKSVYYVLDDTKLSVTGKPNRFRKLLFGLCFFHALIQERRKFGPLGWNRQYEFNETDLDISVAQLELYLDKYEEIPFETLNTLVSYINYGGRVTDAIDSRTIDVILKTFFREDILRDDYNFSESGIYFSVPINEESPHAGYLDYIEGLPVNADPEVFGLHNNANITFAMQETQQLFDTLMLLQPKSSSEGGISREDVVGDIAKDIYERLPDDFDIEAISMQYPVRYDESMNTVLLQEAIRYQNLLTVVKKSLPELRKALKGLVVLSAELEAMGDAMYAQRVPVPWEAKAYPCLKPLNGWVNEFLERLDFIRSWIQNGNPPAYWLSGFFFPQAFLTGQLQNFARAKGIPIDTTSFNHEYPRIELEEITKGPETGCYIHGLYIEGARWDKSAGRLVQPMPKVLYEKMPVIYLLPIQNRKEATEGVYRAPLYKVLSRAGTLSTTGHSTNFIGWFNVPSDGTEIVNNRGLSDISEWIKAGVALFCSLRY